MLGKGLGFEPGSRDSNPGQVGGDPGVTLLVLGVILGLCILAPLKPSLALYRLSRADGHGPYPTLHVSCNAPASGTINLG